MKTCDVFSGALISFDVASFWHQLSNYEPAGLKAKSGEHAGSIKLETGSHHRMKKWNKCRNDLTSSMKSTWRKRPLVLYSDSRMKPIVKVVGTRGTPAWPVRQHLLPQAGLSQGKGRGR